MTWNLPEGQKGRFYYKCTMDNEQVVLPWDFDVSYKLNGVPTDGEKLAGASGLEEIDLLIDAWARDYHEAKAIAKAVRAAMPANGPRFGAHLIEDQDLYEDGTNYFRVSMEYKVWFLETE